MRNNTTMAAVAGVLLGGFLVGCDQVEVQNPPAEELKDQVELTSILDLTEEGEVVEFTVKSGSGQLATHEYVVRDGRLEPLGDAPEMTLPDSHELGVIPVSINGGATEPIRPTTERGPTGGLGGEWAPSRLDSGVPELQVDSTFRVETMDFVGQLRGRGRSVQTTPFETTGPSQATELTRLDIDGMVQAEIYQFDNVQHLDAWYRVAYQLHESVGHDPDARIRINGMTMLRLGDNADEEISEAFLASQQQVLRNP